MAKKKKAPAKKSSKKKKTGKKKATKKEKKSVARKDVTTDAELVAAPTGPSLPGCVGCRLLAEEYENKQILHADDRCLILHLDDKVIGVARQHVGPDTECVDDDGVTATTVRAYVSAKTRWQAEYAVFPGVELNETEGAEDHFILELGAK